ncbi:hypothetical protein C5U62_32045 [Pseudomonas protegens]|uniref:Uncharacterized protein n=1 Tax=Pseudomonas protegens TaxID=380021 RepID=A0A2T6GBD3_9PSED|nr:hypothetical protein [Pseudomonas protegens]PUA41466.1 hypothetical protein C5U62_32045 [Pseudomonas protegens]
MNTAMQICQSRYDAMLPPEDYTEELVDAEVARVMVLESELVPFFDKRATRTHGHISGFALNASETIARACDHECMDAQVVLAVLAGEFERAQRIAEKAFRQPLELEARAMVMKSMGLARVCQ